MNFVHNQAAAARKLIQLGLAVLALTAPPAFAQIAKVTSTMSTIQSVLLGVAITIFTIALVWVGFKMAFQHAKWSEVSNIVVGGILCGGAPAIASLLVN